MFSNLIAISVYLIMTWTWYPSGAFAESAAEMDFCKSPTEKFSGLIHPLVSKIENLDLERLKKFDLEDFDGYMEPVVKDNSEFDNILYKVHVHGDLVFSAEGYQDYYNKLKGILDSYIERKVDRFHEMPTKANYTLHNNGALTISRNVTVFERSKSDTPNGKKIFVCSGFYQSLWIPLKKESMKIEDWRIQSQNVYVLTEYSHST